MDQSELGPTSVYAEAVVGGSWGREDATFYHVLIQCVYRALSLHLFVASILLLREWRSSYDGRGREYEEAIEVAISILKQVQSENEIARHAVRILRNNLPIPHPY